MKLKRNLLLAAPLSLGLMFYLQKGKIIPGPLILISNRWAEFENYRSILMKIGALSYASGNQNVFTAHSC